ncbi:Splicing factor spf30 [Escovopsis weberi]|uniref:Splicing factor spf30 n=1 Tax=Escovopsis weberi TaxID=150374 RepID=A0A0N0RTL1_ESCWE|nr:Splicing factor spf30 [Escovopsis weberi]
MSSLYELEEEKKLYQEQFDLVTSQIRDDPGNAELTALKEELHNILEMLNENIAELKSKQAPKPAPAPKTPAPPPKQEQQQQQQQQQQSDTEPAKWSRENHPAFNKAAATTTAAAAAAAASVEDKDKEEAPVHYQVNDNVLAKWLSGDKAFYPARITSITGSSTDPIYIVKFKTYDNTETLKSRDIRPVSNKRKADGPAATTASPPAVAQPGPGVVSSAGATMYPEAKREPEKDKGEAAKPPKAKKIKANKELEAGKSKWQDFNSKSKFGKSNKKDSMFRTPEGIHGRVGFTGSGKTMRKDPTRSRHVYQTNEEMD